MKLTNFQKKMIMQKNTILLCMLLFSLVLVSCGSRREAKNQEDYGTSEATNTGAFSEDRIAEGAVLVKKSDCETCHHATNTIIGPSHTAVAEKYAFTTENVQLLAGKIVNGGSGQVMMVPHPNLSSQDAEKMAYYILSLDDEQAPE